MLAAQQADEVRFSIRYFLIAIFKLCDPLAMQSFDTAG